MRNVDDRCSDRHDWTDEMRSKVSVYCEKLVLQQEKKGRKVKSSSSSCFPHSALPIPLSSSLIVQ